MVPLFNFQIMKGRKRQFQQLSIWHKILLVSVFANKIHMKRKFILGSNNINLLLPNGQFGSRLRGGRDSAVPHHLYTQLNKITKIIFNPKDEAVLKYRYDCNDRIEPEWYCPIIPMVLVNGCDGIGTGASSKIPKFNPKDIIENIRRLINGQSPKKMHPWYRGFRGTIQEVYENNYQVSGEIGVLGENCVEITELPLGTWTDTYKEKVLWPYIYGFDKTPAKIIDYKEYSTDVTVR